MIYFTAAVAVLGSFLLGFHIAVISGVLLYLAPEFNLSVWQQGFVASAMIIGAMCGGLGGGSLADRLGRRQSLFIGALFCLIGALIALIPAGYELLVCSRILCGVGVGIASSVVPIYLTEIAPGDKKGAFICQHQLLVTCGILVTYCTNYWLSSGGHWRAMLGIGAIPAALQCIGLVFVSESAIEKGADLERWRPLFRGTTFKTLLIGIGLSFFHQITGINAVVYYAPKIFESTEGASSSTALLSTVGIGMVNLLATILALKIIDTWGRKKLLLIGLAGMGLSLIGLILGFLPLISVLAYIVFFAVGLGAVTWVLLSEIFPHATRASAMGLLILVNWSMNYLIVLTFPDLARTLGMSGIFSFFAATCLLGFLFTKRFIPKL